MGLESVAAKDSAEVLGNKLIHDNTNKKRLPIVFLVLDEIDQLVAKDQDVLYRLFELAVQKDSRLVLIGIANAIDLTSRFLPRLKAKHCICLPSSSPIYVVEYLQ